MTLDSMTGRTGSDPLCLDVHALSARSPVTAQFKSFPTPYVIMSMTDSDYGMSNFVSDGVSGFDLSKRAKMPTDLNASWSIFTDSAPTFVGIESKRPVC